MASGIYKVIATFVDADGKPVAGGDLRVRLMDEDRYFDDKLGEVGLSPEGSVEIMITAADILSFDSAGETTPDLYFVLLDGGTEIFRSEVFREVDFAVKDAVTGREKGLTQQFGPFVVAKD
tara:strand:+ start:27744 stop:28106 length:363 start_codon:yes stop_codon:yes gene_type:complete